MTQKRPFAKIKHELNPDFDKLVNDAEQGRLTRHMSAFMTRPAYAYTKAEQKQIYKTPVCETCGYYREPDILCKKECCFPWFDPEDYDIAAYDYLPCKEADYEEN